MKKPKISVIVSVYNTEKYIVKCLDSILAQTYPNLELVIIDDRSKDKSLEIIEQYQKHQNVIIIKNKVNKGLAYSRNIGLEKSTGEYIGYIDSDDYIEPDYYEKLMDAILKEKADIAICDMKLYYEKTKTFQIINGCDGALNKLNLVNNGLAASACNKLFKREIISQFPFAEGKVNEDIAVVIPCIIHASKISYVPGSYYYYVQRENSIQNSVFSEKRFDIFQGIDSTLKRIEGVEDFEIYKEALIYNQIIVLLVYVFPRIENYQERKKFLKKYGELTKKYEMRQNKYFWQFLSSMGLKSKAYYKLLFKAECTGHYSLANFLIFLMLTFKSYFRSSVIKKITEKDLVQIAKEISKKKESNPSISVVIPNYNYERFLEQRLYSILYQGINYHEIILLDDMSTDNSREKIDHLVELLSPYINIKKVYNEHNSGSAFKQWEKGFNLATGDYVWIAEADDYCHKNMIKSLLKQLRKDDNIVIGYVNTSFINTEGKVIVPNIKKEIDIMKTGHWDNSYINDGKDEFKNYAFLNCTIANVSSALIKKDDYKEYFVMSGNYKQAGDWLFYVNIMQKGKVAYVNKLYNYYRVHGNNVSSITKKDAHLKEIKRIYKYYDETFKLTKFQKKEMEKRYKFLKEVWNLND